MDRMRNLAAQVVPALMLNIPLVYRGLLTTALDSQLSGRNPYDLATFQSAITAYCVLCYKHFIINGTIVYSVVRALGEDVQTEYEGLCRNAPRAIGMISVLFGMASILTSLSFASSLRLVPLSPASMRTWLQNARRNTDHPWKNVYALLAAPTALCLWSAFFFVIHFIGWKRCNAAIDANTHALAINVLLANPTDAKLAVASAACLLLSYTINVVVAFQKLSKPAH